MTVSTHPPAGDPGRFRVKLVALGIALAAVIFLAGAAAFTTNRGPGSRDLAASLAEAALAPTLPESVVVWQPDPALDRPVDPKTREMVEEAIVSGWTRIDKAQASGQTEGIDTWFVGELAEHAKVGAEAGPSGAVLQHGHQIAVTFFAIDGSIMTLDVNSALTRRIDGGPDVSAQESYEVVMLLSDGNWRMLHLTRTAVAILDTPEIGLPELRALAR